mmetsp:Transcript_388/g.398  ORF Transcript_388/g.398 Transcript_388/m.398 type:complete len:339 (-) Transcript_388:474-1490(-)
MHTLLPAPGPRGNGELSWLPSLLSKPRLTDNLRHQPITEVVIRRVEPQVLSPADRSSRHVPSVVCKIPHTFVHTECIHVRVPGLQRANSVVVQELRPETKVHNIRGMRQLIQQTIKVLTHNQINHLVISELQFVVLAKPLRDSVQPIRLHKVLNVLSPRHVTRLLVRNHVGVNHLDIRQNSIQEQGKPIPIKLSRHVGPRTGKHLSLPRHSLVVHIARSAVAPGENAKAERLGMQPETHEVLDIENGLHALGMEWVHPGGDCKHCLRAGRDLKAQMPTGRKVQGELIREVPRANLTVLECAVVHPNIIHHTHNLADISASHLTLVHKLGKNIIEQIIR